LGRAIEYEAKRQIDLLDAGERIIQQTRHWNEDEGRTHTLRSKEEADDYRYFPEPDLVPLAPDAEWIDAARASLPRLPADRRADLASLAGVDATSGAVAVAVERDLDDLAAAAIAAGGDKARVLTHIEHNLAVDGASSLAPQALAALTRLEIDGGLTATQAKAVLAQLVESRGTDPAEVAKAMGFEAMDTGALDSVVDEVIAAHPDEWQRYRDGDDKARGKLSGFFVGEVMRATKGKADGKAVTARLKELAS
ncbi:MAG: Asp-tRNA(Asn)/Glu-tRNA(Gln) amidotransferase subunit GatB, partial [Actinobacteria bacterium]